MIRKLVCAVVLVFGANAFAEEPVACTKFDGEYWSGELYGLTSTLTEMEIKITQADCSGLLIEGKGRDSVQKAIIEFELEVIPDGQERLLISTNERVLFAAFEWDAKGLRAIVRDEQAIPQKGTKKVARDMILSFKKQGLNTYLDVSPKDGYDPEVMGFAIKR